MKFRNNQDRLGATAPDDGAGAAIAAQSQESESKSNGSAFNFTTPTEFVDLPSKGKLYPKEHYLHGIESVEIKYMTAKDEDILTSRTLLKKGIAIDRFLQNIVIDKKINVDDLFVGDKNALIVAARVTGYGSEYTTRVVCPSCANNSEYSFDLTSAKYNYGDNLEDFDATLTENQTFSVTLPHSTVQVEVRLMTGRDEKKLSKISESKKKHRLADSSLTDQFRLIMVSVNGNAERSVIESFVQHMPARDSRYLRTVYAKIMPNVDLTQEFMCDMCEYDGEMEVPFTADFFWPKR